MPASRHSWLAVPVAAGLGFVALALGAAVHLPRLVLGRGRPVDYLGALLARIDRAYAQLIGPQATLWSVPDAAHTRALHRDPLGYAARLGASSALVAARSIEHPCPVPLGHSPAL